MTSVSYFEILSLWVELWFSIGRGSWKTHLCPHCTTGENNNIDIGLILWRSHLAVMTMKIKHRAASVNNFELTVRMKHKHGERPAEFEADILSYSVNEFSRWFAVANEVLNMCAYLKSLKGILAENATVMASWASSKWLPLSREFCLRLQTDVHLRSQWPNKTSTISYCRRLPNKLTLQ